MKAEGKILTFKYKFTIQTFSGNYNILEVKITDTT